MIAYTSTFGSPIRTISPPQSFTVEAFHVGVWPKENIRFAWVKYGGNNCVSALSPYTEVNTGTDGSAFAIRIDEKFDDPSVGFLVFWQRPQHPIPNYRNLWFPCFPQNGSNFIFHYSPGDLRWNGQLLIAGTDLNPGPHYNYKPDGTNFYFPRGANGLENEPIPDPTTKPIITAHGLAVGTYSVQAAYLLFNGQETPRTPNQTITLSADKRAILCHRNEPVPQGVAGIVVYIQVGTLAVRRQVFPCWTTWWIGRLGDIAKPPVAPTGNWTSNPVAEAFDSDADMIVVDEDYTLDGAPVIPYKPGMDYRTITSDHKTITVKGSSLLTVNAEPHVTIEGVQIHGPNATRGIEFCDHNGGCNFFLKFKDCNFHQSSGYWLCADDAGAALGIGLPIYTAGHTVSEVWFDQCYCQGEAYLSGNQTVNLFFSEHRQDVSNGNIESAALHARNNKFITFDYLGINGQVRSIIDAGNEAGPLYVELRKLFADQGIPVILTHGQGQSAFVKLSFSNVNRRVGMAQFAHSTNNGMLTVELDAFIHNQPKAFGQVNPVSVTGEAAKIQVVPVSGAVS